MSLQSLAARYGLLRLNVLSGVPPGSVKESELTRSSTQTVLWIIAAILVVVGIVLLFQGQIILGVALIVVGCLVGPGGYSLFRRRTA